MYQQETPKRPLVFTISQHVCDFFIVLRLIYPVVAANTENPVRNELLVYPQSACGYI